MNGQELATAVQYGLGDRVRRRRQRHVRDDPHAPGAHVSRRACTARRSSIPISPRSRARTARTAKRSTRTDGIRAGVRARARRGRPALLHLKLDPQALTMNASLDALRAQGAAGRRLNGRPRRLFGASRRHGSFAASAARAAASSFRCAASDSG